MFSHDVTAAMLVSLNKGTAAMLVSPTNPPTIEFYYHVKYILLFRWKNKVTDHVSENTTEKFAISVHRSDAHWLNLFLKKGLKSFISQNSNLS